MPLAAGTRLGPYEVIAPLGAGGMGEVFRARDTRLGREVAIKVLPASLTSSPESRSRFEREAKTISSLNHPHICVLHDVGREGDTDYLVMELVEGETLAARLTRGALPTAEVLHLGAQIADALDRAHRAGVVHRDLKPGNVMLTRGGAKLMDFGLARATGMAGPDRGSGFTVGALSQSPTMAQPLTAEGTIVGTFQYMSPEQLEGAEADARSDVWALGCVLYEMATGRRAFEGRSQASLISAIMATEPAPISQLVPMMPRALDRLVNRCLAKKPDDRWQSARDVALELKAMAEAPELGAAAATAPRAAGGLRPRSVAVVAMIALAAGALFASQVLRRRDATTPLMLTITMPHKVTLDNGGSDIAVAPDGSAIAFAASDSVGTSMLWLVPLGTAPARALPLTQGATLPFWSADGAWIGFFGSGMLRKVSVAGGAPEDICPAASGRGGSWNRDGVILFAPGAEGPIYRVPAAGGTPVAATALDTSRHQIGHRFPRFLADGKHFFFASTPVIEREHEIFLTELGKMTSRFVLRSDATPAYSEDGWLIFRKNLMLNAQRFDVRAGRLTGSPRPLIEGEQFSGVQASPTAWLASNGLMITLPRVPPDEVLAMVTREGRIEPVAGVPIGGWVWPRISPDGRRIVASRYVEQGSSSSGMSLWLVDAARGLSTRLTLGTSVDLSPSWSPDGRWIVYASNRDGAYALYRRSVSGGGDEFITRSSGLVFRAADWTPDGKYFVCESSDPRTGDDVDLTEADPPYAIRPLLHGEYDERAPRVSPDGRWIAYTSTESGRPEVYVDAFPGLGAKVQVSTAGGGDPQWTKNGAELFFEGLDRGIYVSRVTRAPELQVGPPMRLFNFGRSNNGWTVTADGQHLLMALAGDNSLNWAPRVIVNWHGLLAKGK